MAAGTCAGYASKNIGVGLTEHSGVGEYEAKIRDFWFVPSYQFGRERVPLYTSTDVGLAIMHNSLQVKPFHPSRSGFYRQPVPVEPHGA